MPPRLYLDACWLNWLTDDQGQVRIRSERLGFAAFDALHLACAESSAVDVFLTTDDDLLRRSRRNANLLRVRVEKPLSWYREAGLDPH